MGRKSSGIVSILQRARGGSNEDLLNATIHFNSPGPDWTEPVNNYRLEISPAENLTVEVGQELAINCYLYNGDELVTDWEHPTISRAGQGELEYIDWSECENGYTLTLKGVSAGRVALTIYHSEYRVELHVPIEINMCGENLVWALGSNGTLTISGTGGMYDYTDSAPAPWYSRREEIKKIVLEDGVTSIGNYAFLHCDKVASYSLGENLAKIGAYAFLGCSKLDGFGIPESVSEVGEFAFCGCTGLKYVAVSASLTVINPSVFRSCSALNYVSIPDTVTRIEERAFDGCENLREAYYGGSEEEWTRVSIGEHNDHLVNVMNFEHPFSVVLQETASNQEGNSDTYIITATITNNSLTTAFTNLFCSLGLDNGVALIEGEQIQRVETLAPQESVEFRWTIEINRELYEDGGVHHVTVMADSDQTVHIIVSEAIVLDPINDESNELDFSRDVWSFDNFSDKPCQITDEHKAALMQGLSPSGKAVVEYCLTCMGADGHCYAMSASVILNKMDVFDFSSITGTEHLRDSQDETENEQVHSILCYYQTTQAFGGPAQEIQRYMELPIDQQLTELAQKAGEVKSGGCPALFSYGSDRGAHAVVAYAWEKKTAGEDLFKSPTSHKEYNNRILIYDCNVVEWNAANCLLFNDNDCRLFENNETLVPWEWEIPYYVDSFFVDFGYNFWSENDTAYLKRCTNDLRIIDAKNYTAGASNYQAELILKSSSRVTNLTTGQSWAVSENLSTLQGDTELTYYHSDTDLNSDGPADIHIVLPDEAANYIVEPLSGSADELDFYVLYDEKFVGISAGAAAGLSFSEDGEIVLNGNGGAFELTVADDNIPAGAFNTYTVSGDAEGDITVSVSEEGITVNGDNLNGVTIEASEGDTVDTVTITENTGEVTLEREENGLVEVEEEHVHEYGEPTFAWDENHHCTATFTCVDGDDIQTLNCTVTTETEADKIIYTATVELNGQTYTNTLEEVIETPEPDGLAAPTDLEWGYDYVADTAIPGTISWRAGDPNQNYFYTDLYRVGDSEPYASEAWITTIPLDSGWNSSWVIPSLDLESGTYYFTITAVNEENTDERSETVTSDTWTYTRPDAQVGAYRDVRWGYSEYFGDVVHVYNGPENQENIRGREFAYFYAPSLDVEPEYFGSAIILNDYSQDDYAYMKLDEGIETFGDGYYYYAIRALSADITVARNGEWSEYSNALKRVNGEFDTNNSENRPAITGSWTADLVMSAADLGVSAPDSILRATFTFNEDGTATTTWEAVDLTAFRMFFHDMFVNAYYAMAYGAGITDLNEIEAFCRESTGMSVSDYMDTLVTDEAMRSAFTPASTSGVYRLNEEQNGLYTDMAIMDVQSDPDEENSFVIGNGTMYLNAASYGKPEYTFVCTRVE